MLPDEKIMCHRTGFQISCFDGVVKHKCSLWCHVEGTDAMGHDIDVHGCSDAMSLKFLHEIAKEVRQGAASTDKVANEVKAAADMATAQQTYLINGIRASFPVLQALENHDGRERQRWSDEANQRNGTSLVGHADAAGAAGDERPDPGHGGVSGQGQE